MSDTPRTDSVDDPMLAPIVRVGRLLDLARQLERELGEANRKLNALKFPHNATLETWPVVLYFPTREDALQFEADVKAVKPNLKAEQL